MCGKYPGCAVRAGLGPVQRESEGTWARSEFSPAGKWAKRQVMYRCNPGSPVYHELRGLMLKRRWGRRVCFAAALQPLAAQIRVAFLFGLFAGAGAIGPARRGCDDHWRRFFFSGCPGLGSGATPLGTGSEPHRVSRRVEFATKARSGHHFVSTVLTAPERVFLVGDQHELSRVAEERLAAYPPEQPKRDRRALRRR